MAEEKGGISGTLQFLWFLLVALVIVLRPLYCGEAAGIASNSLIYALILASASFWLLHQALRGELFIKRSGLELPLGLFAVLVLISIWTASSRHFALLKGMEFLAVLVLFFFLIQTLKRGQAWRILHLILTAGLIVAIYGLYQHWVEIPALLQMPKEELLAQFNLSWERWDELRSRIASGEVFSTFALSNSFAGFLVLLIPLTFGLFLDALLTKSRRGFFAACGYGATGLFMLLGLYLSKSDGGALAFVVSVILFAVVAARKFLRRRWPIILSSLIILCILGAFFFATTSKGKTVITRAGKSLEIRAGFWLGAVEVIKHNPLLGVGLANFEPHYLRYKLPWSMETKAAHNDYLQIGAEMGIFALLTYICLWAVLLKKGARGMLKALEPGREPSTSSPRQTAPRKREISLGLVLGLIALLICHFVFEQSLGHWTLAFILPWALFWGLTIPGRYEMESRGKFWRLGLFVGLITFLFHALLDMDLYVPGVGQTALVLGAVFLVSSERVKPIRFRLSWPHRTGLGVLAVLVFFLPIRFLLLPLSKGESLLEKGTAAMRQVRLREAIKLWEEAARVNPSDPTSHHLLGSLYAGTYRSALGGRTENILQKAIKEYKIAIHKSPLEGIRHFYLGQLYLHASFQDKKYLPLAEKTLKKAVELYPTRPEFRISLARTLEMEEKLKEALKEYRAGLKFAKAALQKERQLRSEREGIERKIKELKEHLAP